MASQIKIDLVPGCAEPNDLTPRFFFSGNFAIAWACSSAKFERVLLRLLATAKPRFCTLKVFDIFLDHVMPEHMYMHRIYLMDIIDVMSHFC